MTRASHRLALLLLLSWPLVAFSASGAEPIDQEGVAFFENKIRPALAEHCYKCHSTEAKSVKGGLLLDTKEATRQGGDSGEAVIPGDLQQSLLLSAIRYEDYEMPPSGKLPDAVIAAFEKWVAMGAPDPRGGETIAPSTIDVEQGRQFWAFQPLQLSPLPEVTDEQWPRTEVDRFVLARLEGEGLRPVRDADRTTLIRRLSLDLIGLPPTLAEIDAFVNDESPQALDAVVDRLLESEQFGERWGRHWLDVARYAESIGRTRNYPFSDAWRYRDYVIDAFNADKPYDEFIVEQLAGDLLPYDTDQQRQEQLIATGFLALGSHDLNERDEKVFEMDVVSEQIDTTSRSMLALTVGCARCHDHKFDPIPTTDYYALAGIFKSTELLNGYQSRQGGGNKYSAQRLILLEKSAADANTRDAEPKLPEGAQAKLAAAEQQLDEARARLQEAQAGQTAEPRVRKLPPLKRQVALKQKQLKNLRRKLRDQAPIKIEGPVCLGVRDRDRIADCQVNIRGDAHRLGESVPRGFIQVAMIADPPALQSGQSGRLALAHWIADPRNPLTPRVMANRIWHHLFGRGLVRTVDNFGQMGERPSHPELLDYLAIQFVNEGWSIKSLIRSLVLSRTYRLSSQHDDKNYAVDGDNQLLWRMNRKRLEFEVIRDAMLAVSGRLMTTRPEGSPVSNLAVGEIGRKGKVNADLNQHLFRSVYLPIIRTHLPPSMSNFDFPVPSEVRGARDVTTVPTQALFLMNSPFVIQNAAAAGKRLIAGDLDDVQTATMAYRETLGRFPTESEIQRIVSFVTGSELSQEVPKKKQDREPDLRQQRWASVYQALFACAEFRYCP